MGVSMRAALVAALLVAAPTAAQRPSPSLLPGCARAPDRADPFLTQVSRARELPTQAALDSALDVLEPQARRLSVQSPTDAAAQYRLAAVLGARLDFEHGSSKMKGAGQVLDQARRVLALDATHAGASYIVGKIQSGV